MTKSGTPQSWPRKLLKGGCGCGAFVLGGLIVLVIFLPRLAGSVAARVAEEEFANQYRGRIEIRGPRLGWSSRQEVEGIRLMDPEEREVASLSLEFPSILDLWEAGDRILDDQRADLGHFLATGKGALVFDEAGASNLDAALESRHGPARPRVEGARRGPRDESQKRDDRKIEDLLRRLTFSLELRLESFDWTDPRLEVPTNKLNLRDVVALVEIGENGVIETRITGVQECVTSGDFTADATLAGVRATEEGLLPGSWVLALNADQLSGALADRLAGLGGQSGQLLGEAFAVEGAATGNLGALEQVRLDLRSEAMHLGAVGRVLDGRFELVPGGSVLEIEERVAGDLLEAIGAAYMLEGSGLRVPESGSSLELRELSFAMPIDSADPLSESALKIALGVGPLALRDPFQRGGEQELALDNLELDLEYAPGTDLVVRARTAFTAQTASAFDATLTLGQGWNEKHAAGLDDQIEAELRVVASGVPVDRFRALAEAEDQWEELWGARATFELSASLVGDELQTLDFRGESDTADLAFGADVEDGRLRLREGGLRAGLRASKLVVADMMRERLPSGYLLSSRKAILPIQLSIPTLELDLEGLEGDTPLAGALIDASLTLGALDYTETQLAAGGGQVSLSESVLAVVLSEEGELELTLDADLDAKRDGTLDFVLRLEDAARVIAAGNPESWRFALTGATVGFPTKVLDLYAKQDGLLIDVLGPAVDATFESADLGMDGGGFALDASSDGSLFRWRGRIEEGVLVSGEGGYLDAGVGLTPLMSERLIGPLVPLLVDLEKPDASPIQVEVKEFRLPLDGDLRGLDARLKLTLGQVNCTFLPALAKELPRFARKAVQSTDVEAIEMEIIKGVVRYDRLPIRIDGRRLRLSGKYDLLSEELNLRTRLRLGDLGGELGEALRSARKALGDDYALPVSIGGTLDHPKLSFDDGVVEDALRQALEKGGRDLLERELGKGLKKLLGDG